MKGKRGDIFKKVSEYMNGENLHWSLVGKKKKDPCEEWVVPSNCVGAANQSVALQTSTSQRGPAVCPVQ